MESIVFNKIVCGEEPKSDIGDFEDAKAVVQYILAVEADQHAAEAEQRTAEAAQAVQSVLRVRNMAVPSSIRMVFLSHKTGDQLADRVARYILNRHGVWVYMAEWDGTIQNPASNTLPAYIMQTIKASRALLVQVIPQISASMWIGYEVGGADAFNKPLAKTMFTPVSNLPAVVDALHSLVDWPALDNWIQHV